MNQGIDSADVQARLRRKLQRELQRQESARLAAEAAALADEAELRALAVSSAHALNAYSGAPALRETLEHAAAAHTQAGAVRALAATGRALDAGAQLAAAREALDAAAAAPPPKGALRLEGDPEAAAEAARRARLARLLHPPRPPRHAQPWSALRPDPLALGTARACVGTGAPDYSLIPVTHGDGDVPGAAWVPSARSHEVTLPHPARAPGATGTGTWAGHDAIDAPARGTARGLVSTARDAAAAAADGDPAASLPQLQALLRATTGSLQRFPHDPIPSHVLPSAAFGKARSAGGGREPPLPLPRALLATLTRPQLLAPRHPAYLLDANLHHAAAWRRPRPAPVKTFSEPPRSAPPSLNEQRRAAVAMVPERSLPASDPIHAGKPAYTPAVHAPPLFSRAPLDYVWEAARRGEEEAAREGVFWRAAAVMAAEEGRGGGASGEAAARGGSEQAAGASALPLLPAHLTGPSPSPMRHASPATGEATFRTFSASGMHGEGGFGGLGGTLGRSTGGSLGGGGGGSLALGRSSFGSSGAAAAAAAAAAADAPALSLLTGPQGKFQALRTALVFGSAGAVQEYEAARRSLVARKAMGAKALAVAAAEVEAGLAAMEGRLTARGVGTGLGATGSGSASARGKALAERLRQSLEP